MVSLTRIALVAALGLSSLQNVSAHMRLFAPIARGDFRMKDKYGMVDNNLNAPINADDYPADFPCRHTKVGPVTAKYTAGKSFAVMFKRGNSHRGGHCQFAMSYDNGKTWVVLKSIIGLCFMDLAPWTYHIPLPKGAKSGKALFAWAWMNAEGNREYYMNCADVEIEGGMKMESHGPELFVGQLSGKKKLPEWAYKKDLKQCGIDHFINRKVVTIPSGVKPTRDGTVVGEACNGHKGAKMPPASIPWNRFRNDDGDHSDLSDKTFFIATSDNPGPGVKGDSEAKYPYVKGEDYVIPIDAPSAPSTPNSTVTYGSTEGSKDTSTDATEGGYPTETDTAPKGDSKDSSTDTYGDDNEDDGEKKNKDKKNKDKKNKDKKDGKKEGKKDGKKNGKKKRRRKITTSEQYSNACINHCCYE
ncbi:hypothetical protein BDF22DRAFT_770377 [Syncephalis plumigaleata]|nr:hypothetical protein BDF22DRAFT_770377 [Syncephalis plumigaleata]